MTEVQAPSGSQAERLLGAIAEQAGSIDNVFVVFSKKGAPDAITVGTTGHTPVIWTLGAMEYARWHLFNTLTMNQMAKEGQVAAAMMEHELLATHGVKPS